MPAQSLATWSVEAVQKAWTEMQNYHYNYQAQTGELKNEVLRCLTGELVYVIYKF